MSGASTNIMISGVRRKLTKKNENTFNFVTGSAWTPMSGSMRKLYCISPRISDQSSAIRSYSLHSDNNWTAWRFKFISFSKRSNVTGQHDRLDERLTGQFPNQSGHCLLAPVALQRGLTSPMALVFFFRRAETQTEYSCIYRKSYQSKGEIKLNPHNVPVCGLEPRPH